METWDDNVEQEIYVRGKLNDGVTNFLFAKLESGNSKRARRLQYWADFTKNRLPLSHKQKFEEINR